MFMSPLYLWQWELQGTDKCLGCALRSGGNCTLFAGQHRALLRATVAQTCTNMQRFTCPTDGRTQLDTEEYYSDIL